MGRRTSLPCTWRGCGAGAAYAFLAVSGATTEKIVDGQGRRVRACKPHMGSVVDRLHQLLQALPDGGPARLRTVPLGGG
jgi:hypothetical protein